MSLTDLPSYPSSPAGDLDRSASVRMPMSLRVARRVATVQSLTGAGVAAWLWHQAAAISPARDGDWSQITQAVLNLGGIAVATATLAVALPAVLLGRRGPAPRLALVVSEAVVGVVLLLALPASLGATGQLALKTLVTAALVATATTLVAACRPTARAWSADRYPG